MLTQAVYRVDGMTCGGCVRSVTRALAALCPDLQVEADLGRATVTVRGEHSEDAVRQAIEQAGFEFAGRA
jgi:copper chaperone